MGVKQTMRRHYAAIVNSAKGLPDERPSEGWITAMRKALGMSVIQLAERTGTSRAAIYQAEENERSKVISLGQMEKLAKAMGGHFVYAIVPEGSVEAMVSTQAGRKARAIISRTNVHMALEQQALSSKTIEQEVSRLSDEIAVGKTSDLWGRD